MRKPSLAQAVYNATFPHSRPGDPGTFAAHITRHLVPEVRIETSVFYGPPDCIESQYPGLDYSYGPHRLRLGRFTWHRRLFRVFDALKLTEHEISELCCWEGTKSARQRYELEEGITVRDTTGQDVQPAAPTPPPTIQTHTEVEFQPEDDHDQNMDARSDDTVRASESRSSSVASDYRQHEFEDEFSDEEVESCGVELNNRLRAAMVARDQGDDVPLDEDWEQWFKEAGERDGGYTEVMHAIRSNQPLNIFPEPSSANLRHGDRGVRGLSATTLAAEEWLLANPSPRLTSRPVLP